jgi:hypothetical protein
MSRDDAENYRLRQAENMLKLFEDAHGRPARSVEEFTKWGTSAEGKAALEYYRGPNGKVLPE